MKQHNVEGWNAAALSLLKLTIKICCYPLSFCLLKMPEPYCNLCANPRRCKQVPVYLPDPQGQIQKNIKKSLKKLTRATGCVTVGSRKGRGFLVGPPLPNDRSCHQSSPNQPDRRLKIWIWALQKVCRLPRNGKDLDQIIFNSEACGAF